MEVDRCQEYIDALEEERKKLLVFQRELPLSLQLVSQAIDACRRQMALEIMGGPSESEGMSTEGPVFEEFIPIRTDTDRTLEENRREDDDKSDGCHHDKPDWLRSVQLWNQEVEASPKEDEDLSGKSLNSEANEKHTSSPPFKEDGTEPTPAVPAPPAAADKSSRHENGEEKEGQPRRKSRRCWSPELHRRFLHALQELGGSHATPKQIRDIMKVDGLTNDEVKSHLQKYRLHTRRMPGHLIPGANPQPAQFVVVSGIWVAPEYTAMASSGQAPETEAHVVFTPLATTMAAAAAPESTIPVKKKPQYRSPSGPLLAYRRGEKTGGEDSSSSAASSSHITCFPAI